MSAKSLRVCLAGEGFALPMEMKPGKIEPEEVSADLEDREGVAVEELPLPSPKTVLISI